MTAPPPTASGTPMFVCGPTTGCGKLTPFERVANGWITPRNCMHCGKEWRRLPSTEITLSGDLLYTPAETPRLTRVEVIDHRAATDTFGRAFVAWNVAVTLFYQDDGRTLKVFVDDAAVPRGETVP